MFCKPKGPVATRHIFVGNCGPAVGLAEEQVQHFFQNKGAQAVTFPTSTQVGSSHVFVTFETAAEAQAVLNALNAKPAAELENRRLVIKFAERRSDHQADKVFKRLHIIFTHLVVFVEHHAALVIEHLSIHVAAQAAVHVHRDADTCGIPGLGLHSDFVSHEEEQVDLTTFPYWQ